MQPIPTDFPIPISEDCLFLNVWTPTLNSSANLSVMFWIHGGGFVIGSGYQDSLYSGSYLALRNVVVVTINYRLGVFGFFYGNSSDAPGNQGYWDMTMALDWTINNIAAFGGNPNSITVFGESAGSISISNLIVSNVTRYKFQQAIMQSGTGTEKIKFKKERLPYISLILRILFLDSNVKAVKLI
jgi:carboxylesterase type B